MRLKALYNAVIVKPVELEDSQYGRIIVPDLGNEKNKLGEVVEVGSGYYTATGTFIQTEAKVGQKVVLPTMGFTRFEFKGEEYFIGPENQLLAIVEEDND